MYIALKWLVSMVLAMWITLCLMDICKKNNAIRQLLEIDAKHELLGVMENSSILTQQHSLESPQNINHLSDNESVMFHYIMFIAGACMILICNKKNEIIMSTKITMKTYIKDFTIKCIRKIHLKKTADLISVAIPNISKICMGIYRYSKILLSKLKCSQKSQQVNIILLNKLKEYSQERKYLGRLLISAIQENKNIRMQYQLETMARKRLARNMEDNQKVMKENRSQYVSFQQLYIVTHQENTFLKSRIKKLTQEKDEAERNLITLVNHVWQSKNNELKAYCSRFIVKTKTNLLYSDAKAEVQQFIRRTSQNKLIVSDQQFNCFSNIKNDILEHENSLSALVKDAPKLRGLPGECVWTVKDKDGIIEKLYEYETEFDNGDIISRIRQYSVYCDKECLLDLASSTTLVQSTNIDSSYVRGRFMNSKRITGSQAFQKFLQNNKNTLPSFKSVSPHPSTL